MERQISAFAVYYTELFSLCLHPALPPPSPDLCYPPSLISPAWLSPAALLGPLSTQPPCVISLSTCQWERDLFNVFEEQTTRSLKHCLQGFRVQGFFFSCVVSLNHFKPRAKSVWLPSLSDLMRLWLPTASHHRGTNETWRKKYEGINSQSLYSLSVIKRLPMTPIMPPSALLRGF